MAASKTLISRRVAPVSVGVGLSDIAVLRRVIAMAFRYRVGMAIAIATTVVDLARIDLSVAIWVRGKP